MALPTASCWQSYPPVNNHQALDGQSQETETLTAGCPREEVVPNAGWRGRKLIDHHTEGKLLTLPLKGSVQPNRTKTDFLSGLPQALAIWTVWGFSDLRLHTHILEMNGIYFWRSLQWKMFIVMFVQVYNHLKLSTQGEARGTVFTRCPLILHNGPLTLCVQACHLPRWHKT